MTLVVQGNKLPQNILKRKSENKMLNTKRKEGFMNKRSKVIYGPTGGQACLRLVCGRIDGLSNILPVTLRTYSQPFEHTAHGLWRVRLYAYEFTRTDLRVRIYAYEITTDEWKNGRGNGRTAFELFFYDDFQP